MSVTVENGAVVDITILEQNDTPNFFERAKEIINDIINTQSLDVDAVSQATYSSIGIVNAVNNALESSVTSGELEQNKTELPQNHHFGDGNKKGGPGKSGNKLY